MHPKIWSERIRKDSTDENDGNSVVDLNEFMEGISENSSTANGTSLDEVISNSSRSTTFVKQYGSLLGE